MKGSNPLASDIKMKEESRRKSSSYTITIKSSNSNPERKVSHQEDKIKFEDRLAIISVNSFEGEREEDAHLKSPSLSFHFDALEQTDQQSSISWESSSNFSPDNSCQNCSFNFWSQKLKNREKILARKSITIQKLVLKAIFKMGVIPSSSSSAVNNQIEASSISGMLVLTNRGLSCFPLKVLSVKSTLRLLDMSANQLPTLPSSINEMSQLKSLFLNQNRLAMLPDEIGDLEKLEFLSVAYNFLESLPRGTARLENLRELKLSGNRLKEFPEEVISLKRLRLLDLSINDIETIHATDLGFEYFQVIDLNLNENLLSKISPDLSKSPRLKILRLQNNLLSLNDVPEKKLSDSKVIMLLLDGNKFEVEAMKELEGYETYLERIQAAEKHQEHSRSKSKKW